MFEGLILRFRARVDSLVRRGVWGAVAILALIVALLFFAAAAFVVAQAKFGTLYALLGFAVGFLLIALLAAIGLALTRRSAERRQAEIAYTSANAAAPWWLDPRLIATGLDLSKTLGGRRVITVGLVGAFLVGLWLSRNADRA